MEKSLLSRSLSNGVALKVTSLDRSLDAHELHTRRLLVHTNLQAIAWINHFSATHLFAKFIHGKKMSGRKIKAKAYGKKSAKSKLIVEAIRHEDASRKNITLEDYSRTPIGASIPQFLWSIVGRPFEG